MAIAGTIGNGGHSPQRSTSVLRQASAPTRTSVTHTHPPAPLRHHAPKPRTTQTLAVTPAAATTAPPTAETLEARGHALMAAGNYATALSVLRQAVDAASPGSLTYAYALYDYGRTLLLAGDPKAAVTILYQRLQIPNQTAAVRQELQAALVALGQNPHSGGAVAGPPAHRHHRHHRHHRGGRPGAATGGGPPGAGPGPGPQPSQGANTQGA